MILSADTSIRALDVRTTRSASRSPGADFSRSLNDIPGAPPPTVSERAPSEPPTAATGGFVRSSSSAAPGQVPRFESVPEAAQWPQGPYKQAPAEFGGEWWLVNPFSGPQPWVRAAEIAAGQGAAEKVQPPDDFVKLFGPRPEWKDSSTISERSLKSFVWERELATFEGVGIPEGLSEAQVQKAKEAFAPWDMGEPVFYKSRGGWAARFPDSQTPEFQISPETAVKAPQMTIAVYQIRAIQHGIEIENRHPLTPSDVVALDRYKLNA